ncbi:DUF3572 domain-containing protein [Falsirhodobacter algicola]|uniref:DUF3572 family protein n=1 Tax=Falsirhodobacter algicola TaxID=2692330 RepID=A0A8J8SJV6_9RHOB|nr:DUF3572 domain-containing protein [Falsirhodobacter algicola]QUS34798.1 DUF3572 family protein [Falsirhodobacter algicola]
MKEDLPSRDAAERMALQALAWLAARPELLPDFLSATGASPGELRQAAAQPAFLGAVMDFILSDDAHVIAFCDMAGLPYTAPMRARAVLPGGDLPHWT